MATKRDNPHLPPPGTGAEPASAPDLLLYVLAAGGDERKLAEELGLSQTDIKRLPRLERERLSHLRLLQAAGERLGPAELSALMRARLAEMLLSAESAQELAALLRAGERFGNPPVAKSIPVAASDQDLGPYDLAGAVREARKLLSEIDTEEAQGLPEELAS